MSPSQIRSIHSTDTILPFQMFFRKAALLLRDVTEDDSPFSHVWLVIAKYPDLKRSRFKFQTICDLNHPVNEAAKIGYTRKGLLFTAVEIAPHCL
jgi:hypothetical protein